GKRKRKTKKEGSVKKTRVEYKKDKDEGSETELDDIPLAEKLRRRQNCSDSKANQNQAPKDSSSSSNDSDTTDSADELYEELMNPQNMPKARKVSEAESTFQQVYPQNKSSYDNIDQNPCPKIPFEETNLNPVESDQSQLNFVLLDK
ncbi:hypothetical protein A2U01_0038234, partial [Trifolium medium]|nr:hypothetical protein [Trifolium medium]